MSSIKHINTHKEFPWRSPALFKYVILLSALLVNFCWSQLYKVPDLRRFRQLLQIVIVIWIIQISDYSSCDSPNYFFFLQETMLCSQVEGDDRKWHICSWRRGWRRWIRQCLCNSHPNGSKELPGIAFWFFEKDYVGLFPFILVWMRNFVGYTLLAMLQCLSYVFVFRSLCWYFVVKNLIYILALPNT